MKNIKLRDIVAVLIGLIIGIIIMAILWPKRIAKLSNGEEVVARTDSVSVTADDIYKELKNNSGVNALINLLDRGILEQKYTLTDDDIKEIKDDAEYYFELYESTYGVNKEDFLKNNGFKDEEEFTNYLELDYLRKMFYEDYISGLINDEDIENYYNKNTFSPFNVEHILVRITDSVTDEQAKSKATEILNKLKKGTSFDKLKEQYKDEIITEAFEVNFASNLEDAFFTAAKKLKDNSYSKELVKTSYGYHIIYRKDTLDKPSLEESKESIKLVLKEELKSTEEYSYANALADMRKDNNLVIFDTELKSDYKASVKNYE